MKNLEVLCKELIKQIERNTYTEKNSEQEHNLTDQVAYKDLVEEIKIRECSPSTRQELLYSDFTKVEVESGYLYNFWDSKNDTYGENWVFVPSKT